MMIRLNSKHRKAKHAVQLWRSTRQVREIFLAFMVVLGTAFSPHAQSADKVIYYHNDGLGSPIVATDADGDVLWRESYSPYGSRLEYDANATEVDCSGSSCEPIDSSREPKQWFTAKYEETRQGIQYFGARWYDPSIGRFISPDPVMFTPSSPMSFNQYAYANNNPYGYVDPDGEFAILVKLGADFALNVALNYATTGKFNVGGAAKETALGAWNPLKTAKTAAKLAKAVGGKGGRKTGPCCFVAGTQVLTKEGHKNIEDVQLGELLYSKNVETGEEAYKQVTTLFQNIRLVYELSVVESSGASKLIETTDNHPFYVPGKGFVNTIDLIPGDVIESKDGDIVVVESVADSGRYDVTYNFEVADFHTYYATEFDLLVHNCGGPVAGGGASVDNLSPSDTKRIQNAANRTNQDITVVGSRASGNAGPTSDWDYVMSGRSSQRHSASSSVPRGSSGGAINSSGRETGIDIGQSYNSNAADYSPVRKSEPHITFKPKK